MSGGEKPAVHIYCLLFDGYETLDLMGPVEFLHSVPGARLHYVSHLGGAVRSTQGFSVATESLGELKPGSVLLIPGGAGTRTLVHDTDFVEALTRWVQQSEYCLSVCTGSALLAATGLLNELEATTNKRAFDWGERHKPARAVAGHGAVDAFGEVLYFLGCLSRYGYDAGVHRRCCRH